MATWCQRDNSTAPFTPEEENKLDFLYSEWTHPHFISINVSVLRCSAAITVVVVVVVALFLGSDIIFSQICTVRFRIILCKVHMVWAVEHASCRGNCAKGAGVCLPFKGCGLRVSALHVWRVPRRPGRVRVYFEPETCR